MKLYITDIENISLDRTNEISSQRAEKVARYKKADDKRRCIAGGLFIKKFLGDEKISINSYGKPMAENGVFFNISHSGRYVIFAIANSPVGCDIEKVRVVSQKLGKIVFCDNELESIRISQDKITTFFDLWTKKESLLKCIGEGFHKNSKSVDVSKNFATDNSIDYHFKLWHFSDYTIAVCSGSEDFPKDIEFISL